MSPSRPPQHVCLRHHENSVIGTMSKLCISTADLLEDIVQMELATNLAGCDVQMELATNLAGSDVLKHILSSPIVAMQGMSHVEVQAVVAVVCW